MKQLKSILVLLLICVVSVPVGYLILMAIPFFIGLAAVCFMWLIYRVLFINIDDKEKEE